MGGDELANHEARGVIGAREIRQGPWFYSERERGHWNVLRSRKTRLYLSGGEQSTIIQEHVIDHLK